MLTHVGKYRNYFFVLLLITIMLLNACGNHSANSTATNDPITETFFIFDTVVTVKIYDSRANEATFDGIRSVLETIDQEVNRQKEDSEIAEVNRRAGDGTWVNVSEETFTILKRALQYSQDSNGTFDLTVGPLVDLWGIGSEHAAIPPQAEIQMTLELVDYTKVELDEAACAVRLAAPGMSIDLGGIAKGYAADAIADFLRGEGFTSAIIDLGGNVLAMGAKPGADQWTIGIQNPEEARGAYVGTLKVTDQTIVSSGVYERYFIEEGVRYHHIMNTTSGYPVNNGLTSVTVVTKRSFDADGRSNTAFSLGVSEGMKFIEAIDGVEAIFITDNREVYTTSGLKGQFHLTNPDFQLIDE